MKVKFFCTWWGIDHLGMEKLLYQVKEWGYDGVEVGIPKDKIEKEFLKEKIHDLELEIIAHQYQADDRNFEDYKISFLSSLKNAAGFGVLKINSHTGRDYWTSEQNLELVEIAEKVANHYKIPIVHETHRGRFLYSAPASAEYFKKSPNLQINLDISHWCCVSESLLEDQLATVEEALKRTGHIHARVGHAQGPQVIDPRHPKYAKELEAFTYWWKEAYRIQKAKGEEVFTITPEFGPTPYSMSLPDNDQPYVDPNVINLWMKDYLKDQLK